MSCPAWSDLSVRRDAGDAHEAWGRALVHFDECSACRREALRADPTLVFRRLPTVEVSSADIESMRRRVALLRRARELERIESPPRSPLFDRWARAARVACLLLVVGSLTAVDVRDPESGDAFAPARSTEVGAVPLELPAQLSAQPVLEEADGPFHHVVEWTHADLSFVVLVDDRLDV